MLQIELAGKYHQPPIWHRIGARLQPRTTSLAIFAPFAAGYFLSYWIRTINGPISDELVREFALGPADLGLLTSLYFLTFAGFQVPAGVLIDRYGPRLVQAGLLLVAAAGTFMFAAAQDRAMLMVGRALIGLGCSAALMTGIKALAHSLPAERRAMGNSCMVMCGGLGAIASAAPIGTLVGPQDWRIIFTVLGLATLAVLGLVWFVVPRADSPPAPNGGHAMRDIGRGLARVMRDRGFWRVAPLSASTVGAAFAVHGLWAARWLADVGGLTPPAAASILLAMGVSLTFGALAFGLLATWLRRHGVSTTALLGAACAVFLLIEAVIAKPIAVPPLVSFGALAIFSAITVLSFTIMGELFPPDMVGRANGLLNTLHLGAAGIIQAGIGAVVALWPVPPDGHSPAIAYTAAFAALMAVQAAALAWFMVAPARRATPAPFLALEAAPATASEIRS